LILLSTLQRMRPLRRARQNCSSEGCLESDEEATSSISRSHSAASFLLVAANEIIYYFYSFVNISYKL
jgi:hypothetical protein